MKYMGHKGKMLPILGEILLHEGRNASQFADPFCGSATVSWYMAQHTQRPVIAGDLQNYATARAVAVITRQYTIAPEEIIIPWFQHARLIANQIFDYFPNHFESLQPELKDFEKIQAEVHRSRKFSEQIFPDIVKKINGVWPTSKAYGGYYYSPAQAIVIDALRQTLPKEQNHRNIALAALIEAASKCAAAPGHTAQPFQPTESAAKYIFEAWKKDVYHYVERAVKEVSAIHASAVGKAITGDYRETIAELSEGDLVFADPPYSGVHYSRFYHVLETISNGQEIEVSGRGRYPDAAYRPVSSFSRKSESLQAAKEFLELCSNKRLSVVLTFPSKKSSNGLSSEDFVKIGNQFFSEVKFEEIESNFSTLGGNKIHRNPRALCNETIIIFRS